MNLTFGLPTFQFSFFSVAYIAWRKTEEKREKERQVSHFVCRCPERKPGQNCIRDNLSPNFQQLPMALLVWIMANWIDCKCGIQEAANSTHLTKRQNNGQSRFLVNTVLCACYIHPTPSKSQITSFEYSVAIREEVKCLVTLSASSTLTFVSDIREIIFTVAFYCLWSIYCIEFWIGSILK